MPVEIERKFLVPKDLWYAVHKPAGEYLIQGYLYSSEEKTVRIRLTDTQGFLTIKGPIRNYSRNEFEYLIPREDAMILLQELCISRIEKMRYRITYKSHSWDVDEFLGENDGLILAEIELKSEEESLETPPWIGSEVTGDRRYYNAWLAEHPFTKWNK